MKASVALVAIAACAHATHPVPPDPLWTSAQLLVGDGAGHLPRPARALVALDGRRALAALDGGGLAEIDLARGETTRSARDVIDGEVAAMARLRDGRVLAVGSADDHERAWWIDPSRLTARSVPLDGAAGDDRVRGATGVAASDDGAYVVITGVRLPLALRDPKDLSIVRVLSPERNWSNPVFVAGTYLVAFHHGQVVPYELQSGKVAVDKPWTSTIGFTSPDGLALLHPMDLVPLELTDLHNPDFKVSLSSADPIDVAWSPDGGHVVVVDSDRVVVYDVPDGIGHPIAVPGTRSRAIFSRDGMHLVITADGALWRVDPITGKAFPPKGPALGAIAHVAIAGDRLITIADRWRDSRGTEGGWRGVGGPAFAVSPSGAYVIASSTSNGDAFAEAWETATARSIASEISDWGVRAVDARDDGTFVVATPSGSWLVSPDGEHALATERWAEPVEVAGDRVVYARAGSIAVADLGATQTFVSATAFDCDASARVKLSRDGTRLAIVSGDRVALYDVDHGARFATGRFPAPLGPIALDAHRLLAATGDRLLIWEADSHDTLAIPTPATITAIDLRGDRVALGFADGRAGIWALDALRTLAKPTALRPAGPTPTHCAGDPLAPAEADSGTLRRIPPR